MTTQAEITSITEAIAALQALDHNYLTSLRRAHEELIQNFDRVLAFCNKEPESDFGDLNAAFELAYQSGQALLRTAHEASAEQSRKTHQKLRVNQ